MALGFVLASFSVALWQTYLTQGFLYGIGTGLTYFSTITSPSRGFAGAGLVVLVDQRPLTALGAPQTGSSANEVSHSESPWPEAASAAVSSFLISNRPNLANPIALLQLLSLF